MEAAVGDGRISPREAEELAACFAAHAGELFGYGCWVAQEDRALAEDLVQATFEAAAGAWRTLRDLTEEQRRGWLRRTLSNIAVSGFRREAAFRDRLPRIEARYRKIEADPPEVTEVQEPRFAAGYDLQAGLDRYRTWLRDHARAPAPPDPTLVMTGALPAAGTARAEWSADLAIIELHAAHYRALVRLAALIVRDTPTGEEVAQDAFIALHQRWGRLQDTEKALAYLRQTVVNRSRSVLRHRAVVERKPPQAPPDMPSAEHGALAMLERSAVASALHDLPGRQREAILLRYYADLSEAETAAAMRISRGAVKSHVSRGMAALRAALDRQ